MPLFVIASGLLAIFAGIQGRASSPGLSYQDIHKKLHLWRLIISAFAFSSTPESMFGLYLLYYFRVFERHMGSNKYSVLILFSMLTATLFEVVALALLKKYSLLKSHNKLILKKKLLLSSWKRSLLPGICGILAGGIYRLNVVQIRRAKFPEFIASFFSRLSWLPSGGSPSVNPSGNFIGGLPSYAGHQLDVPSNYPASAPFASATEPPEDSISTLVSMCFDRNMARQALVQSRNDVNAATTILLETQAPLIQILQILPEVRDCFL